MNKIFGNYIEDKNFNAGLIIYNIDKKIKNIKFDKLNKKLIIYTENSTYFEKLSQKEIDFIEKINNIYIMTNNNDSIFLFKYNNEICNQNFKI